MTTPYSLHLPTAAQVEPLADMIPFGCGAGHCMICAIRILEGHQHLNPPTEKEQYTLRPDELKAHIRLACQLNAQSPCQLTFELY